MHEFSIANPIVKKVLSVAKEKKAKKIKTIEISIGELLLLGAEEEFRFWLKEMFGKEKIAKGARIKINIVNAAVKCGKCGYEGGLELNHEHSHDGHSHSHPVFLCPKCEDTDLEIKEGKDCVIERVQVQI